MSDKQVRALVGTPPMPTLVLCEGSGEVGHRSAAEPTNTICARCGVRFYGLTDGENMPEHKRVVATDIWG